MEITRESPGEETRYRIRGYGPGEIRINNVTYTSSLLLAQDRIVPDWNPPPIAEWTPETLNPLLAMDPEIILVGTGSELHLLGMPFLAHALRHGCGLEVMTTDAACRTFSVLSSEDRKVAAALIID